MSWTAVVPLKQGGERKSRLAPRLSKKERAALSDHMAARVLDCLKRSPSVGRIILLSPLPIPPFEWRQDKGRGLNAELTALRDGERIERMLVIHGDLPLVEPEDVEALIDAAKDGCALAPDRHGAGTNALALATLAPFQFSFGEGSLARHRAIAGNEAVIVQRAGLSLDVDTPGDLDAAIEAGFYLPSE